MDHYLDIRVLPDPEFSEKTLLEALFAKLHRALGAAGEGRIGVSFPEFGKALGSRIRLHGTVDDLHKLQALPWQKGLRDYAESSAILPVPGGVKFRVVRRVQVKSSAERLRRRSVKKGWLTEEQARQQILSGAEKRSALPALQLKSLSTGQDFMLFIQHGPLCNEAASGSFSAYGLSASATIPWF